MMLPDVDEPPAAGVVLRRKRCRFCRDELVTYRLDDGSTATWHEEVP